MYRLNQIKLNINHSENDLKLKIAKTIKVSVDDIDWSTFIILHKSIDARDKSSILFVYNVAFDFVGTKLGVEVNAKPSQNAEAKTVSLQNAGVNIVVPKKAKVNAMGLQAVGADTIRPNVWANVCKTLEKYEPIKFSPYVMGKNNTVDANVVSPKSVRADIIRPHINPMPRPVVVGFGPAGIFAGYIFALNGLKPIIIERGKSLDDRTKDVEKFFKTMELDEESNVCFGEGGAGAFSDGKLNTNNKDKTGIYHFILETFVKFGADERILYENMPHIGTDKLVDVIKNIRNDIVRLGGEIHYSTKLVFKDGNAMFDYTSGRMASTHMACDFETKILKDTPVVLAIGNSSRDSFRDLIANGFDLKPKPFAIGYRIAHRQSMIDDAQYGRGSHSSSVQGLGKPSPLQEIRSCELCEQHGNATVREKLGPAAYKLTYDVENGHSVYSFCMCPGGYIINSSNFKNMLSINGMSYNDRSGKYANSAIVETISPEDVLSSKCLTLQTTLSRKSFEQNENAELLLQNDAIKMIEFQEMVEKRAFELENGFIPYVTSDGMDICIEEVFKGQAKYSERLKTVFDDLGLKFNINDDIEKALKHFNKIIPGFFREKSQVSPLQCGQTVSTPMVHVRNSIIQHEEERLEYIIAGVETRTSSPVKLDRDENFMCNVPNYYPCGEGLGHGGGIISCAADGVKVAMKIIETRYI